MISASQQAEPYSMKEMNIARVYLDVCLVSGSVLIARLLRYMSPSIYLDVTVLGAIFIFRACHSKPPGRVNSLVCTAPSLLLVLGILWNSTTRYSLLLEHSDSVLIFPVYEELLYRVLPDIVLDGRRSRIIAVINGLVFALGHDSQRTLRTLVLRSLAGIVLWTAYHHGGLACCVAAHVALNVLGVVNASQMNSKRVSASDTGYIWDILLLCGLLTWYKLVSRYFKY